MKRRDVEVTGCPIAYAHPCSSCAQFGNCAPSQAVVKLNQLEVEVNELRQMLAKMEKLIYAGNANKN